MAKLRPIKNDIGKVIDIFKRASPEYLEEVKLKEWLELFFQKRKSCIDECYFVRMEIKYADPRDGTYTALNLRIEDDIYFYWQELERVASRKFNPEKMTELTVYRGLPREAHPDLVSVWYQHMDKLGFFCSFSEFVNQVTLIDTLLKTPLETAER